MQKQTGFHARQASDKLDLLSALLAEASFSLPLSFFIAPQAEFGGHREAHR
jgi:hypothetical protein